MRKIKLDIEKGKIVNVTTEGMKAKPISRLEKARRVLTRNRDAKQALRNFNAPIVYPNLNE